MKVRITDDVRRGGELRWFNEPGACDLHVLQAAKAPATPKKQGSAVANKPARRAASRRTCCKKIRWTLSAINLRPN